jgi:hypothetical protein
VNAEGMAVLSHPGGNDRIAEGMVEAPEEAQKCKAGSKDGNRGRKSNRKRSQGRTEETGYVQSPRSEAIQDHSRRERPEAVAEIHDIPGDSQFKVIQGKLLLQKEQNGWENKQEPVAQGMGAAHQGYDLFFLPVHHGVFFFLRKRFYLASLSV